MLTCFHNHMSCRDNCYERKLRRIRNKLKVCRNNRRNHHTTHRANSRSTNDKGLSWFDTPTSGVRLSRDTKIAPKSLDNGLFICYKLP